MAGFCIGHRTVLWDTPTIVGADDIYKRLHIGSDCLIGVQTYFDLADAIVIGNRVAIGPRVVMITGSHEIGEASMRAGKLTPKPVHIGDGVWIGACCTILPGVTIGSGAVIAAGAVVTKDIPPSALAAGVPAVVKRALDEDGIFRG